MPKNYNFPLLPKGAGGNGYFDITGQVFHKLTVLRRVKATEARWVKMKFQNVWLCQCECGQEVETVFHVLVSERMKACGRRGCFYPNRISSLCPAYKAIIIAHRESSDLSAGQIATVYQTTKNAVIGILDRNGLIKRINRKEDAVTEKRKAVVFPPPGICVFPHGHPGNEDFHWCDQKATHGSWCKDHYDRVFVPNTPKIQKLDQIVLAPVKASAAA
jgi:hypothetical protein